MLLQDGPATYRAMLAAMGNAKDHINLETYIIEDDETGRRFADLLLEKQAKGIQVNLICYDEASARSARRKSFFDRLKDGGVQVLEFNPVNPLTAKKGWEINNRDHRKLLVVDGRTAFIGGINISNVYSSGSSPTRSKASSPKAAGWRDTQIQIDGPVVAEFQKLFLATWEKQHGAPLAGKNYFPALQARGTELVRSIGSSYDDPHSLIFLTLMSAITYAEKSVHLTNASLSFPIRRCGRPCSTRRGAGRRDADTSPGLYPDSNLVFSRRPLVCTRGTAPAAGVKIYERWAAACCIQKRRGDRRGLVVHRLDQSLTGAVFCTTTKSTRRSWGRNSRARCRPCSSAISLPRR